MEEFHKRPKTLPLAKALKLSYLDNNNQKKKLLKKYGYRLDEDLSSHNQTVAYNPFENKLLQSTAGSHNLDDFFKTDVHLAFGNLKRTKRFNEARETLQRANEKYKDRKETVLTGESLGGTITSYLPYDANTRAFAVNSGYTIGQQSRDRQGRLTNYRIAGDPISSLSAGHKLQNTLNVTPKIRKGTSSNPVINALQTVGNFGYDIHVQRTKGTGIAV